MPAGKSDAEIIRRLHVRLSLADGVGPITFRKLLDHFSGDVERIFCAGESALRDVDGVGPKTADAIRAVTEDDVRRECELAERHKVQILCRNDASYPVTLTNIYDPPPVLYVRGTLQPADAISLAVVGSRRCTHYGMEQAERFGGLLGRASPSSQEGHAELTRPPIAAL